MFWSRWKIETMQERLAQLGLTACPLCESESFYIGTQPAILPVGGLAVDRDSKMDDENIRFMVRVVCAVCGYTMLFDSEFHATGATPVLHHLPPDKQGPEADAPPEPT